MYANTYSAVDTKMKCKYGRVRDELTKITNFPIILENPFGYLHLCSLSAENEFTWCVDF